MVDYGRKWLVEMRERKDRQRQERLEATIKERKVLLLEAAQARSGWECPTVEWECSEV